MPAAPRLSSHNSLVDQALNLFLRRCSLLIGLEEDAGHAAKLIAQPRQLQGFSCIGCISVVFQSPKQVFQREWKCQGVATCPKAVPGHVRHRVEWGSCLGLLLLYHISGLHSHTCQHCDARARTYGFHDGDLLLCQAVGCIPCPHVIGQAQWWKPARRQFLPALFANRYFAVFTEDLVPAVVWMCSAAMILTGAGRHKAENTCVQ